MRPRRVAGHISAAADYVGACCRIDGHPDDGRENDSSTGCGGGPRRPFTLLMNVTHEGVYIVVNPDKGGGIQPERNTE